MSPNWNGKIGVLAISCKRICPLIEFPSFGNFFMRIWLENGLGIWNCPPFRVSVSRRFNCTQNKSLSASEERIFVERIKIQRKRDTSYYALIHLNCKEVTALYAKQIICYLYYLDKLAYKKTLYNWLNIILKKIIKIMLWFEIRVRKINVCILHYTDSLVVVSFRI